MNWEHKCSIEWLCERQKYLTASDIKSLIPVTRTGRPRKVNDEAYYRVLASKLVEITEEDCWSFGAAARGHILEPYAIDALNVMLLQLGGRRPIYWWDDKIVTDGTRSLAFSPDGLDIPQDDSTLYARTLAEVKCYSDEKHIVIAHTPKEFIEERWQIATAMAVLDTIENAYLVLYNPRIITMKTVVIEWTRDELEREIETVINVEMEWDKFVASHLSPHILNGGIWQNVGPSESELVKTLRQKGIINPTT